MISDSLVQGFWFPTSCIARGFLFQAWGLDHELVRHRVYEHGLNGASYNSILTMHTYIQVEYFSYFMVSPFHWELCKGAHGIWYKFIHTLNIHVNTYTFSLWTRVSMETSIFTCGQNFSISICSLAKFPRKWVDHEI